MPQAQMPSDRAASRVTPQYPLATRHSVSTLVVGVISQVRPSAAAAMTTASWISASWMPAMPLIAQCGCCWNPYQSLPSNT